MSETTHGRDIDTEIDEAEQDSDLVRDPSSADDAFFDEEAPLDEDTDTDTDVDGLDDDLTEQADYQPDTD